MFSIIFYTFQVKVFIQVYFILFLIQQEERKQKQLQIQKQKSNEGLSIYISPISISNSQLIRLGLQEILVNVTITYCLQRLKIVLIIYYYETISTHLLKIGVFFRDYH